jgi:hypothetical protein
MKTLRYERLMCEVEFWRFLGKERCRFYTVEQIATALFRHPGS